MFFFYRLDYRPFLSFLTEKWTVKEQAKFSNSLLNTEAKMHSKKKKRYFHLGIRKYDRVKNFPNFNTKKTKVGLFKIPQTR